MGSPEKSFGREYHHHRHGHGVVKGGSEWTWCTRLHAASRSGARDAAEMESCSSRKPLPGIIKLDAADEDVVVDRRAVAEEDERSRERPPLF